jgi:dTDP-4-amino-4,6-dideoxygalactose transaminase
MAGAGRACAAGILYTRNVRGDVGKLEAAFAAQFGFAGAVAAGYGRAALRLVLEAVPVRGRSVLVPAFICRQVVDAVRAAGGLPQFYAVNRQLEVTLESLARSATAQPAAAIIPHYWGQAQPHMAALAGFCAARNIALIEDAALALGHPQVGRRGAAIFSFTKSEWCHGGGVVASHDSAFLARCRELQSALLRVQPWRSRRYGWLSRADYLANRPARARLAELAGRTLERIAPLGTTNFYDAGRDDAALPAFAARRALRILADLEQATARRRAARGLLRARLASFPHLFLRDNSSQDTAAFLLMRSSAGRALAWTEEAARRGITLRRCWPAYQQPEPHQAGPELDWFADHLLILDIHPQWSREEVDRISESLKGLAARE